MAPRGDRSDAGAVTVERPALARLTKLGGHDALWCSMLAAAAFAFLAWRASSFFPNARGLLGHDYSWFFPTLVAGHFWNQQNGWLALPHFTPAVCGGVPFLANPQSVFFSLPQVLLLVLEPTGAVVATLLISAAAGAAGCFVLLRRYFVSSIQAATLSAILFLLNGFLFYRMVVGHLTYHALAVVPLLACVVASSQRVTTLTARAFVLRMVLGGALIGYVTYAGALNFQIPVVLTVVCAVLMLQIERGFRLAPWLVLGCSCLWGALLSAMKMIPAAMLVSPFPRPYLRSYLFQNPFDIVQTLLTGFLVPAVLPGVVWFPSGAGLDRHEFEFGVTIVPLVLLVLAVRRGVLRAIRFERPVQWLLLAVVLFIPVAVTFGPGFWGGVLARVPVINSNTTLVRWWALYLLPTFIVTARCFDVTAVASRRSGLLVVCLAVSVAQEAGNNSSYYVDQAKYDPRPVTNAYRDATSGRPLVPIDRIFRAPEGPPKERDPQQNDAFVAGASPWPCYEPIFGYFLDLIPDLQLVDGPITLVSREGRLNVVDPASYLVRSDPPGGNWRFEASRLSEAEKFAAYLPYEWPEPWWHRMSVWLTLATVFLSVAHLARRGVALLTQRRQR